MIIDARFPNGMKYGLPRELKFTVKHASKFYFCQIIHILMAFLFLTISVEAHHATPWREYFSKYPGLTASDVRYPWKNVYPKQDFTRSEITKIQMRVCNAWSGSTTRFEQNLHQKNRVVKITVSNKLDLTKESVSGLGYLGLRFAWKQCPAKPSLIWANYAGIEIEVWRSNQLIYRFARADQAPNAKWVSIQKLWSVWDEQYAREQREKAERERQQRLAASRARQLKAAEERAATIKTIMFWLLLGGGIFAFFKFRGPVMAFYYHNFTSHPAEKNINQALRRGEKFDGDRLADELDKAIATSNPIEAEVRAAQARDIAAKARKKTDEIRAQEELAGAMMDVERAKRAERRAREAYERAKKNKE